MRRLRRIFWTVATAGSLVLCVALVGLWVRSYWVSDGLYWQREFRSPAPEVGYPDGAYVLTLEKSIHARRGGLFYTMNHFSSRPESEPPHYRAVPITSEQDTVATLWRHWGFANDGFGNGDLAMPMGGGVRVPLYPLVLLTAALPAVRLVGRLRRRRRAMRVPCACVHCGYDCRATPGRCPECGTAVAAAAAAATRGAGETEGV